MLESKNIIYKIIETWEDTNTIVVRYYTEIISEEELASDSNKNSDGTPIRCRTDVAITLPFPIPNDEEIEDIILNNAPIDHLDFMEKVKNPNIDTKLPKRIKNRKNKKKKVLKEKILERRKARIQKLSNRNLSDEELLAIIENRTKKNNDSKIEGPTDSSGTPKPKGNST